MSHGGQAPRGAQATKEVESSGRLRANLVPPIGHSEPGRLVYSIWLTRAYPGPLHGWGSRDDMPVMSAMRARAMSCAYGTREL